MPIFKVTVEIIRTHVTYVLAADEAAALEVPKGPDWHSVDEPEPETRTTHAEQITSVHSVPQIWRDELPWGTVAADERTIREWLRPVRAMVKTIAQAQHDKKKAAEGDLVQPERKVRRRRWMLTGQERWQQSDRQVTPLNSGSNKGARKVSFVEVREVLLDCGHWHPWGAENARRGWSLYCNQCSALTNEPDLTNLPKPATSHAAQA